MQYYSSYGIPIRGVSENQTASNSLSQLPHFQDLIQPISNNYTKQNEKKIEKEKIEKQYQQYFKDVLPDVQMTKKQCLTPDVLEKHRVTQIKKGDGHLWAKSVNQCDSYVQLSKCLHSGMQCVYNVFIGEFFLAVNVLHLHINSYQNINKQKILGKGTYGLVRKLQIDGKQIALKKISFLKKPINQAHLKASKIINQEDFANEHEIKLAVREYAFYKICSMLKIGPQVIFEDSYDLICYNDCVEFKMQLCQNISQIVEVKKYEKDIKRCLATLHSLKIIHKDMKKTNTLYSKAFNSYVLADFGLAHTVIQQIWEKTQTNFSGTWGNASPQMQKIFKKREPQFINLYMNDIYGLKITLKELYDSWKPIQKKYQKNVMSDYKSASQECSQNVSYEDSDYNQNSSQESTKKIENQYYMRGGNKNYMNDNKKSQEILSQRIDYYQIKALSRYLDYYKKQSFKISTTSLQNILRQVIGKQEDYDSLMPELLKLITPIIQTLYKNQQFNLMNIRNCIRIFGLRSKEFLNQLNKLSQKNSNPNINCQPIKYYLKQAQKNNKIVIKKFDNHILNMYRHLCLRNQISLSNSLRSLLKNYLEENPECKKKNQEILIMVLQGLTFQGLTQTESFQILQMISAIFYKKSASVNKNNYRTCCIDLMQKLFEHLKERKRVSVRSLQNMARIYMNMQFDDKAKHYIEKISEHRKDMQRKLRQEKKLQKSEEQEIKGKIINSKLIQWNYLAHEHKFEQALQKLIKLYKQFTEYQIKDQSLKINILDNIVAISIRLSLITQAQFYNNLLKAQLQKYCLPSKVSIQFSLFFSFRGQILKHYGKHEEALQNFENVLQYTNDPLRGPNYIKIVKNAFFNIADCHNKMGDRQKCLMYLQKNYQFSKTYEHFQNEQTVQVIQHIIINMLLLKKSSYQLAFYFHELTNLKAQIFNSPFCPLTEEKKRIIPLFSFGAISQNYMIDQDYLLMARKIILPFAEQHMPLFSNWYIRQNQLLLNHYHKREQYIKSCRYLWNSLKYVSNPQKNDKYYQKLQIFIQLLIRCNSSRRAWRYLKKYAYYIPEKFMNYKLSMFKTLSKLSSQLNTTEQNFYHFIQKYKAIKSLDNLMEAQFKFQQTFHNVIYRKIYERKLKMIELHIEEKRAVIINMDENYSQNPEPQLPNPINRESSVTTQDIIRRKLSLYKSNRQKHKLINVVQ